MEKTETAIYVAARSHIFKALACFSSQKRGIIFNDVSFNEDKERLISEAFHPEGREQYCVQV